MFSVQATVLRAAAASNKNAFFTKSNNSSFLLRRSLAAKAGQAEVVLVGCGAPNRGMGWYHAVQMLEGRYVILPKKNERRRDDRCSSSSSGIYLFSTNIHLGWYENGKILIVFSAV